MAESVQYSGDAARISVVETRSPAYQAYQILHVAFVVAPLVAGIDKFFHALVNWDDYLAPVIANIFGGNAHGFMMVVGVVEIVAGIGVALKPKIFAYVVAAWLVGIIINLLLIPGYYDIALRDLGLCLAAIALARLSLHFDRQFETTRTAD
jgi:uncharacterized membrane protein YphA (DoxX/SURF4 family)